MRNVRYALGLALAVTGVVTIQALPHLERYSLARGDAVVEAPPGGTAEHAGSRWRLISLEPAQPGELAPAGTRALTAVIGVTPLSREAGKALAKGCAAAVRDPSGRVWTSATGSSVTPLDGVEPTCARVDKNYKAVAPKTGKEVRWQASFVVPAAAADPLRVEVRLEGALEALRLAR
ncbi:hypothetical protein AB0B45_39405 [Nonomuraea sp. NPDC049152]|uniref:hypothetical protein n=1 Tax=Nonomuraea sp. NPDC049152 TaxID=3154350 RepID=UPI0033CFFFEF